jgi:hypothetical protein
MSLGQKIRLVTTIGLTTLVWADLQTAKAIWVEPILRSSCALCCVDILILATTYIACKSAADPTLVPCSGLTLHRSSIKFYQLVLPDLVE